MDFSKTKLAAPVKAVHAFVKYSNASQIGVFSAEDCASLNWSLSREYEIDEDVVTMRCVPMDKPMSLYTLTYAREPDAQKFDVRLSVDAEPHARLENPPITLKLFAVCGIGDTIYALDSIGCSTTAAAAAAATAASPSSNDSSSSSFTAEELARGIYAYNCDLNKWLPVPAMKRRVFHSILTTDGDQLFALGGKCEEKLTCDCKHVQFYDKRTACWEELPDTDHFFSSRFGDGVLYKDKLAAFSMDHPYMQVFDFKAGKWFQQHNRFSMLNLNECDCLRKYAIPYSYGTCRLLTYQENLYLYGIGTQDNHIWQYNREGAYFSRISSLSYDLLQMRNYSRVYDVVIF